MKRTAQVGPSRQVKILASFYRDKQGWSGGPHYFVADSEPNALVFEGTPITSRGVHSPNWNGMSIGIEMCANFVPGVDNDDTGGGLRIKDTTCKLAAALLYKLGLPANNDTVKLHKEGLGGHDDCPGRNIEKPDLLVRIRQHLADMAPAGEHDPGQIPTVTKERSPPKAAKRGVVNTDGLNLRAGSGMASPVVARLSKGTEVEILNSAENAVTIWLRAKVPSIKKEGWLSSRYLDIDGKPVPQPPGRPEQMVEIIVREGRSPREAFALTGNAQVESYSDLRVEALGDQGTAFGIFQWRGPRLAALKNFAMDRGTSWLDFETEVLFGLHELATTEKRANEKLRKAQSLEEAVDAVIGFLRPSKPHRNRRLVYARNLEKWWNERRQLTTS
jgi:hypothetical protein